MTKRLFGIIPLLSLLLGTMGLIPVAPQTPPHPPVRPPRSFFIPVESPPAYPDEKLDLPPLKAVLLVGPIDGDTGTWTTEEKVNMDLAAAELEANGVTVYKFYTPNNNWDQIKIAANGAQFLLYRGHGVYWSPMPNPTVGGFALKDRFVSSEDIRNDLHLAPNAIVMLYGCFTAGSSGNDTTSISSAEAQRRVAQYSDPFFDIGAAGYFADWFGDAFQMYVRYLFQGKTLRQAYESYYDFNSSTVERYIHPDHPSLAMWLDKDYWYNPLPQYNNAFAGLPNQTLTDLFAPTSMQLSTDSLVYIAETDFPSISYTLQIDSTTTETFNWTATITPTVVPWMSITPIAGLSGEFVTVTITPTATTGLFTTNIQISADDPNIQNHDQTIPVELWIEANVYTIYLPIVRK